ncbi:Uncharacterised protein [Yersinia aldovae]|uniref:Uncharacterized protein n=1 Tax=Yersinia aldovae TaxID=29483 RepID=A0ABM9SQ44_YERAL|nr:Uncharacterised protein [Yersinia aldovae]
MLLKNSVSIERVQEHRLRLTSRLQVIELLDTDINTFLPPSFQPIEILNGHCKKRVVARNSATILSHFLTRI